jgi:predicted dehydrogenase
MGISVGMVGVGAFGQAFIEPVRKHPLVDRVALCDINAQRLADRARKHAITETYDSLDEICESDLDALMIITQPWLHAPQVIQALEAGKHAYSAVPITTSAQGQGDEILEWVDRLIEAVEDTGQLYMMGETTFFRPETMYCRRRAAAGDFGEFVYGEGEYFHDLSHGLYDVAKNRWGAEWSIEKSGGVPMHYPTHSTSGLISVMGAHMTHVSCSGYTYPDDDWFRKDTVSGNLFSNEVALYRMSNGATARICEFRRIGHVGREGFRIYGTQGSFENDVSGAKWVTTDGWEKVDPSEAREPLPDELTSDLGGHGGSHSYLVHEFIDACVNDRMPRVNAWEAARYVAAGVMAHESALRDGEVMKVPDWGDAPE